MLTSVSMTTSGRKGTSPLCNRSTTMPAALLLALGDLADRHILGILVRSLLITLAIFALLAKER